MELPNLSSRPNILIAPDSFKSSLSAYEAASAIAQGVRRKWPEATIVQCPLSDGGEGLSDILMQSLQATEQSVETQGPLGETLQTIYGIVPSPERLLVMDVASVIGLPLVPESLRNPCKTHTRGLACFMHIAQQRSVEQMIIGLGGSSTVDGGVGMAVELGYLFENAAGVLFQPTADTMGDIRRIIMPEDCPWQHVSIRTASDVRNPLLGVQGAARIFGPQKGASQKQVEHLEAGLANLAECWKRDLDCDVSTLSGGGAAGGLGAGLAAFCDAQLEPGIDLVLQLLHFDALVQRADLIITGEGQFDTQSLQGKVVDGVARAAEVHKTPVIVVAGDSHLTPEQWPDTVCRAITIMQQAVPLAEAMKHGARYLADITAVLLETEFSRDV